MKKGLLFVLILAIISSSIPLFASTYYEKGNTFFTINAGVLLPVNTIFPKDSEAKSVKDNLKLGGLGSLSYQACISPEFAIGGEIGYCFNYVIDKTIFTQVPIAAKASYIPVQTGKFDLLLTAKLGLEFIKVNGNGNTAPFGSVSINPVFYFSENWGVGLSAGYSACYEFKDTQSAIYGQSPLSLTVSYRK